MSRDERQKPWGDGESYNRYIISELSSFSKRCLEKDRLGNIWKEERN